MKHVREESGVLGKASAHARLKKTRSNCSKVGVALLLDHVNLRSSKGNSMRARSSRVWLKALASAWWNVGLFLQRGSG